MLETICVVDDEPMLAESVMTMLRRSGYPVHAFPGAVPFFDWFTVHEQECCLVISDIEMPGLSGLDLCQKLKDRPGQVHLPIILVTGGDMREKASGIEAGADDIIPKPFTSRELLAKVRSLLGRRKREEQTLNQLNRVSLFVSPNIVDHIGRPHGEGVLTPHQSDVTVVFVDLRRFTQFAEQAGAGEVMGVLDAYYRAVCKEALDRRGTLGTLAGDGVMVFFNDPEPVENHRQQALEMALAVRAELGRQRELWRRLQYPIDFGIGLAAGVATIGRIGFDRYSQYSVIGPVTNLAARLCQHADHGQILVTEGFLHSVGRDQYVSRSLGSPALKGIRNELEIQEVQALVLSEPERRQAA